MTPNSPPRSERRAALIRRVLLIFILLFAAALRFHGITRYSIWSDELFSVESSAGRGLEHQRVVDAGWIDPVPDFLSMKNALPLSAVATSLARDDNHPPLYFYLLRFWRDLFGSTDFDLRAFSAVVSLIGALLMYDVARLKHGDAAGLWAAALMAGSEMQIHYAQEARGYGLALTLTLAACAALVRIEQRGVTKSRLMALGGSLLAMVLTHYYAVAPAAALGIYAVWQLRGRVRRDVVLTMIASAIAFSILWGWGIWQQRINVTANNWWVVDNKPGHFAHTLMRVALLPMRFLNEPMRRAEPFAAIGAVMFFVPFLMLRRRPDLLLWGLLLAVPTAFVLGMDLARTSRQLEFLRYTFFASPAVYAMIAAIIPENRGWMRQAIPAAALLSCITSFQNTYETTETPKPDWRIHATAIDARATPDDVIFFYTTSKVDRNTPGGEYLALEYYAKKFPPVAIVASEPLDPATVARLQTKHAVWTVVPGDIEEPADLVPGFRVDFQSYSAFLPRVQRWVPIAVTTTKPGTRE